MAEPLTPGERTSLIWKRISWSRTYRCSAFNSAGVRNSWKITPRADTKSKPSRTATACVCGCDVVRNEIGGGVVPGGRGELPGVGAGGLMGGEPRLIGGGLVPGGRGELPGMGAGVVGGDPAWITGRFPFAGFANEVSS